MEFKSIRVDIPHGCNIIVGQSHFIKTVEDIYEIIVSTVSQAKFGIAFSEASGPCLIRSEGNDEEMVSNCIKILQDIACGHVFCVLLKNAFPINILNSVKSCPEVCRIYCATANPLEIIVASTDQGNGIIGVIDGYPPKAVESFEDRKDRKEFLRKIGYKL